MNQGPAKWTVVAGVALLWATAVATPSWALTAELAKKCQIMATKTYPIQPPGSTSNFEEEERAYFRQCVANNGHMDDKANQTNTTNQTTGGATLTPTPMQKPPQTPPSH